MPAISIVGAGNWIVCHDRIGPLVLERCSGRYGPEVELFNSGSAGLSLLDCLNGQDLLLVVDACQCGGGNGEIHVLEFSALPDTAHGPSIHQIGPVETLKVAEHLYPEKMPRKVLFILVETDGLDEDGLESACDRILPVLDKAVEDQSVRTPKKDK
ncbi:MAG: hydrogenase maturation protease [Desulfovibrionales bacterium]